MHRKCVENFTRTRDTLKDWSLEKEKADTDDVCPLYIHIYIFNLDDILVKIQSHLSSTYPGLRKYYSHLFYGAVSRFPLSDFSRKYGIKPHEIPSENINNFSLSLSVSFSLQIYHVARYKPQRFISRCTTSFIPMILPYQDFSFYRSSLMPLPFVSIVHVSFLLSVHRWKRQYPRGKVFSSRRESREIVKRCTRGRRDRNWRRARTVVFLTSQSGGQRRLSRGPNTTI